LAAAFVGDGGGGGSVGYMTLTVEMGGMNLMSSSFMHLDLDLDLMSSSFMPASFMPTSFMPTSFMPASFSRERDDPILKPSRGLELGLARGVRVRVSA